MDITMCTSTTRPVRKTCYRAQAKPHRHQSYSNFEYTCHESNGFVYYIPMELNDLRNNRTKLKKEDL